MVLAPEEERAEEQVAENLIPRRYQEEIFVRAQQGNVIAALDTGSGKTFISTMLIKWIASKETPVRKVIVFLVPKVALVEQQGDFVAAQTPLRVKKCYGAMAIDMADRLKWKEEFDDADVLVMTAQIFLNILTHCHWSMDRVSLLIIDECHHCRKNHAYNGIMREYFQYHPRERPKVFGMTASPIWNPKDAVESLTGLERNMDSKVIAVREHIEELLDHSPRPTELICEYPPSPEVYDTYPGPTLQNRLHVLNLPYEMDIPWDKIQSRYEATYENLGPYGAELYLYTEMRYRLLQLMNQPNQEPGVDHFTLLTGLSSMDVDRPDGNVIPFEPELRQIEAVLSEYIDFFGEDERALTQSSVGPSYSEQSGTPPAPDPLPSPAPPTPFSLEWCAPKIAVLVNIVVAHYTPTFQGIIFVEQRHIAACLARMLERVPQLRGCIQTAELIGHGATSSLSKSQLKGMALRAQQDVVKLFREKQINLLIATSVAEEGLDFPACDVVVRFDPIQHMVGYVQSRGRARHQTSTFVIMVQQANAAHMARYKTFYQSEPELKRVYQQYDTVDNQVVPGAEFVEGEERENPDDIMERERYVVPSTGAILTYNTAISLLNHLCSLIPRDRFTPVHLPKYTGDYEVTLELPPSLPLPPDNLVFKGPKKRSKKEAKRAVAFMAVKLLHQLNVFDDYLLPAKGAGGIELEDEEGRPILDVTRIPDTMDVLVRDPFTLDRKLWLHVVTLDGRRTAGLITGTQLPTDTMTCDGVVVRVHRAKRVIFDDEQRQRELLQTYTRYGIWWCVTARAIKQPLTSFLVPLQNYSSQPDWHAMECATSLMWGNGDWSSITEQHHGRLVVMNYKEHGRTLLLRQIRHDLTPMSKPPEGTREGDYDTYHDYYLAKYTRKEIPPVYPLDEPLIEVQPLSRLNSAMYSLESLGQVDDRHLMALPPNASLLPRGLCRWADLSEDMCRTYRFLPRLLHRLSDLFRVHCAKIELGLPPIPDDLLIETYTLPSANAGYNNQRLETLGDAVLKLSTVVYLFNRYPHRHEGQLDVIRRSYVANRTLLARAKENGLEHYLTGETQSMRTWRYVVPWETDISNPRAFRYAHRRYPRRSLQDCMEATLGASFLTGGITMAVRAGTALGLCLGGTEPWSVRYGRHPIPTTTSPLFGWLQERLGYEFHRNELLVEAVTHPSFRYSGSPSYQRLEFMGDGLLDLVVMHYLFRKFPDATSGQLSWARSRAVCAPTLAAIAVKRLNLHQLILVNNVELGAAIARYVPILEDTSYENIVKSGWKHDPPKAISDVVESVLAAVLVDSAYNYEKAAAVTELVMEDVLEVLNPDLPKDPVSGLMIWAARQGCRKMSYRRSSSQPDTRRNDSISVVVHDIVVVGPVTASNLSLAKGRASEQAKHLLEDPEQEHCLARLCTCGQAMEVDTAPVPLPPVDPEEKKKLLSDETEEGFAALARARLKEFEKERRGPRVLEEGEIEEEQFNEDMFEEMEVEMMLLSEL